MSKLFSPITVRNLTVRNRVWIPPMCQYACENKDGLAGSWHRVHYTEWAIGGAGMIIVEATAVTPIGRISPWCAGIWSQEHSDAWKPVVASVHEFGGKIGVQLAHAGRKGSSNSDWSGTGTVPPSEGGWQTVSSTDRAFEHYETPRRLDISELAGVSEDFAQAARYAVAAGFDMVEIHAAHGYLMHQFLSPLTNDRSDIYGGSLENRARLLIETVIAVRNAVGDDYPVAIRFSASDWMENGWTPDETATVAQWCLDAGADFFDISSGGIIGTAPVQVGPGYQVPFAETVGSKVDAPVSAVGMITTGTQAEEILQHGIVDVIMVGRASLGDPYWALRAAKELGETLDYQPKQFGRAII